MAFPRISLRCYASFLALAALPSLIEAQGGPSCPPEPVAPTAAQMAEGMRNARNHGFLWRISKAGRTSFLYGTIHVGRLDWMFPGPAIIDGIRSSDMLALELDVLDPGIVQRLRLGMAPRPGQALPKSLNDRLRAQLRAACLSESLLTEMSPEMAVTTASMMVARRQGLEPSYGIDSFLAGMAHGIGKPVASLETPELQMKMLSGSSPKETEEIVAGTLDELEKGEAEPMLERLATVWKESRLSELEDYEKWCECLDTATDRAMMKRLLNDRNPGMADGIDKLHASGKTVFAAVGSLHMIGKIGLPALLAQRGFKVERVDFNPAK